MSGSRRPDHSFPTKLPAKGLSGLLRPILDQSQEKVQDENARPYCTDHVAGDQIQGNEMLGGVRRDFIWFRSIE